MDLMNLDTNWHQKNENNNVHNIGEIINKSLIEARSSIENISLTNVLKIIENIKKSSRIYVLSEGLLNMLPMNLL